MENKGSKLAIFTKGLIKENPVLVLVLGTCPTLATTSSAINGLGMGLATTAVLICANIFISLLKKIIPDKVRIPAYVVVIATFVTIVQYLLKAYIPALDKSLGLYIPLIVVNCIILGRAEAFASKNSVFDSALDGAGMGLGFTGALFVMGGIRELLGAGTLLGFELTTNLIEPMAIMKLAPGGFFVFGCLIAIVNKLTNGKASANAASGCMGCPGAAACGHIGACTDVCIDEYINAKAEEITEAIAEANTAEAEKAEGGAL